MESCLKAKILALLRKKLEEDGELKEAYVSGQDMCEQFQVTRAAVWKAIKQLQKEGYAIEAVPNRGYRLIPSEEIYGRNELSSRIHTNWAGKELEFYDSISSTNIRAKEAGEAGAAHGMLFVADKQTLGRGRRGREWSSPSGANIYMSLLIRPDIMPDKISMLTLVMGYAVTEAIRHITKEEAYIKWPNDVIMKEKKVCGILTELSAERDYVHYVVMGVGINVKNQEFQADIVTKATSIEAACGSKVSRSVLIQEILSEFEKAYDNFCSTEDLSNMIEAYNHRLVNMDKQVKVLDPKGEFYGIARGITANGELIVEKEDGFFVDVYAGEVSVRGTEGYL